MKALILLADGFEEIEAVTVIDVLRRAEIDVTVAGVNSTILEGSHRIRIDAEKVLDEVKTDEYDAVILPGGPGHQNLMKNETVLNLIKEFDNKNKIIAAICAAPAVLGRAGILEGKKATIYPGMEQAIPRPVDERVVMDNNIITAKGPGTAIEFALKLVEAMADKSTANRIREEMII